MSDWTGNSKSVFVCNGASNHTEQERQIDDFYATEPKAVELLLREETFSQKVWEPACGAGHMSMVLEANGYCVKSSDITDRGYPGTEIIDFLSETNQNIFDIITNPPYKYAKEFVEKAIEISAIGTKIAMLLKLNFLETKSRRDLFNNYPPKTVYVFSSRIQCAKNGDFINAKVNGPAVAYAWFIWVKGFNGYPNSIRINGVEYAIDFAPNLRLDDNLCYGYIDYNNSIIFLSETDGIEHQHRCITLLHEILHGIINNYSIKINNEEEVVEILSRGIYQVLQDNGERLFDLKEGMANERK